MFVAIVFFIGSRYQTSVQLVEEFKTDIESLKEWSLLQIKWTLYKWDVLWEETYALISVDWIKFVLLPWSGNIKLPFDQVVLFTWKVEYLKWSIPYITVSNK